MYFSYCQICKLVSLFFLIIRRPPISTRTVTLFPSTTLFRSILKSVFRRLFQHVVTAPSEDFGVDQDLFSSPSRPWANSSIQTVAVPSDRSEERRVGNECVSTC